MDEGICIWVYPFTVANFNDPLFVFLQTEMNHSISSPLPEPVGGVRIANFVVSK